jgi:hypothetical protein
MFITIFGTKLYYVAIIVFVFVTLLVTELIKWRLYIRASRKGVDRAGVPLSFFYGDFYKVLLSWIIGAGVFLLIWLFAPRDWGLLTIETGVQYFAFIIILNGGYKLVKKVLVRINKLRRIK